MSEDGTAPTGVLQEISARLAAITPEQFIAPGEKREEGATFVVFANDEVRRLFTLRTQLANEYEAAEAKMKSLAKESLQTLSDAVASKGPRGFKEEALDPTSLFWANKTEIERMSNELRRLGSFAEIVDKMFWFDVRSQHPDIADSPWVGIASDWSLWRKEDSKSRVGARMEIISTGDLSRELFKIFGGGFAG